MIFKANFYVHIFVTWGGGGYSCFCQFDIFDEKPCGGRLKRNVNETNTKQDYEVKDKLMYSKIFLENIKSLIICKFIM